MQIVQVPIEKLLKEYTALAPTYDKRWSAYLHASLAMTREVVASLPAERVLDVACGTGLFLAGLANRDDNAQLVGIDRVPGMLHEAERRLGRRATLLVGDAAKLPFCDAAFQLVVTTNSLHYFPDADGALREMRRVLSSSGSLVITDWNRDYAWMKLLNRILPYTHDAHVHTLSSNELTQSLSNAGFSVVSSGRGKIDFFWGLMTIHAIPK